MNINNGFNVLPWYDSLEKQNSKKWYAYGQEWPLLCPQGIILPFQFICDSAISIISTIYAINAQTGVATNLGITPTVTTVTRADVTYYVVKLNSVAITSLPVGRYNLRMNTNMGYLYSEEITVINNASECIKLEYWNEDTLRFTSGEINFEDDFRFILYINSTIGKPEYEFEEELTKRLGYKFIESQTSNKLYKFAFVAPEYICDALRLVRMCDYIKLTTKYDSYNALSFAYEPKWQEQGDLAAVDVEFDTDCIIQKLESFNRRVKESFYNALLADIDEPVLFSTDTVAQYYTEYTSVPLVNGKLIRQLEAISPVELQDSFESLVLALDNQADSKQEAKKVFVSDILGLVDSVSKLFKGHYDEAGNLLWIEALSHIGINGGLTMYIDNGKISLPSLYAGLPIDNNTLVRDTNGVLMINPNLDLGSGGGASSWDELEGIPSWIGATKPTYEYSEIENTPDLSKYVSSDDLSKYVTLGTEQTISGKKNFTTGGLFVNGKQIQYDTTNGCWKLEGNLLVTGGVTMYADGTTSGGSSAYSTLGSLLNVDDSIDASATVDRVLFQAAGSSEWVTKPLSEIGGSVSGDYLPLSGGTLTGGITFPSDQYNQNEVFGLNLNNSDIIGVNSIYFQDPTNTNSEGVHFIRSDGNYDVVRAYNGVLMFATNHLLGDGGTSYNTVWHSGNDGNGSGLDADLLDGMQPTALSVLSASKLTTVRTIWGQSFDGSGNVSGDLFLTNNNYIYSYDSNGSHKSILGLSSTNNLHVGIGSSEAGYTTSIHGNVVHLRYGTAHGYGLTLSSSGDIGIGTTAPSDKLHVNGGFICKNIIIEKNTDSNSSINLRNSTTDLWQISARYSSTDTGLRFYYYNGTAWNAYLNISTSGYIGFNVRNPSYGLHLAGVEYIEASSAYGLTIKRTSNTGGAFTQYIPNNQNRYSWAVGSDSAYRFGIYYKDTNSNIDTEMMYVDGSGNMLVTGGFTMYSDERKKTILNHVELSLKQIANAPLIEHYYNSDPNKMTHVGSIAQYWAGLNDWFCKLDAEGFYTMEIQNAALASAISIARHLARYETKTDKKIRQLKKRISQLEDEIELLKKVA